VPWANRARLSGVWGGVAPWDTAEVSTQRTASGERTTKETEISITVDIDGGGRTECATGVPFFDHMLDQLGRHGGMDLTVRAAGDTHIDAHHTVEDAGILLGQVLRDAWGDKRGVRRFASVRVPLDEAVVECVLDLSGRPFLHYGIDPPGEKILGDPPFDPQLMEEFWRALATSAGMTLHLELIRGRNTHHIIEASVKAAARALRDAVRVEGSELPSTKGTL
jgi:imidazoleglycerol-phosphate dehydratase